MKIKKLIKRIGKRFVTLRQEDEGVIKQSVLVVDNGYSWLGHLSSAIEIIRNDFPKAEISVLTSEHRKYNLQRDYAAMQYIFPSLGLRPKRYRIALQMLRLRKLKYDSIVLFSLDITPLIVALIFLKTKVFLYNQWGQWWSLKLRDITELFKVTYVKKKVKFSFKDILKRIGLFFVLLQRNNGDALRHSILIVDNGYALFGQIVRAIERVKNSLPRAEISVLTLEQRRELKDKFPDLKTIKHGECIIRRYRLARHMIKLKKNKYDYVILLSLDITPIIVSVLFMNIKVILYNQWHQWWLIESRSVRSCLMVIPQFIYNIIISIYLLMSVLWIFLKRTLNVLRFSLFKREGLENYGD